MDGLKLGFWMCSCCNQVFHADLQCPINLFGDELFKCALCDAVEQKHRLSSTVTPAHKHVHSVVVTQTSASVSNRFGSNLSH